MKYIAEDYLASKLPYRCLFQFQSFNKNTSFLKRVAQSYEFAKHNPYDLEVHEAYQAFKEELLIQFQYMIDHGINVKPWLKEGQPYENSKEMLASLATTDTLYVFLTESGYGTELSSETLSDHLMLEFSGIKLHDYEFCYNDIFRAVHDYYSHYLYTNSFSLTGECKAALRHLDLFSKKASRAVFSETVGQICWFYFSSHLSYKNHSENVVEDSFVSLPYCSRLYPEQKCVLLPEELQSEFYSLFS